MILHRISTILARFGSSRAARLAAREHAAIWRDAARVSPQIIEDLIRQGGLMLSEPVQLSGGHPEPAPIDPLRMAYEKGRRDFALQLLSAAGITQTELKQMTEDQSYE